MDRGAGGCSPGPYPAVARELMAITVMMAVMEEWRGTAFLEWLLCGRHCVKFFTKMREILFPGPLADGGLEAVRGVIPCSPHKANRWPTRG